MSDNGLVVIDANSVLSTESVENYTGWLIGALDDEFSTDNAGQALADMIAINTASRWAIGDVLVWARLRLGKHLVAKADHYDQAIELAREKYGPGEQLFPALDVLDWRIHVHSAYWILQSSDGSCRIWETTGGQIDERGFNRWLTEVCAEKISTLSSSWKTIASYYRTSLIWPHSRRTLEAWSYSMYKEIGELGGGTVEAGNGAGLARLPDKTKAIDTMIDELEEDGPVTAGRIRQRYRRNAAKKRGYAWQPPMPRYLYVKDTEDQVHLALEFNDMDAEGAYDGQIAIAQMWIMQMAGVTKPVVSYNTTNNLPGQMKVDDALTAIRMMDGRLVAEAVPSENPLVTRAVEDLVLKLGL